MSASRTTQKELLSLLARIAAACEADRLLSRYIDNGGFGLYDEIIETLEEAAEFTAALNDWGDDHRKHFDAYPAEFEYEGRVWTMEEYMPYLYPNPEPCNMDEDGVGCKPKDNDR